MSATTTTAGRLTIDLLAATDLDRMTALIGPWLIDPWSSPSDRLVAAEVVDQKQGRRALLRYRLAGPAGDRAETLLGKLYADAAGAERVHDLMIRLDRDVFAGSPGLGVPLALGWCTDPPLLVYRPALGVGFDDPSASGDGDAGIQREAVVAAARWLARLHGSRLELDRRLDVDHEVANAEEWAATITRVMPSLGTAAESAVVALRSAATGLRVRTDVPIHKDFHHQHLVLGPDRLSVVDLDEARLGDAALDVAHFVVYLQLRAIRSGAPADGPPLARSFVDSYRAETGWAADERFAFFGRYTAVKIAKQLAVGSGLRPRPAGAEAERQARLVLERLGGAPS